MSWKNGGKVKSQFKMKERILWLRFINKTKKRQEIHFKSKETKDNKKWNGKNNKEIRDMRIIKDWKKGLKERIEKELWDKGPEEIELKVQRKKNIAKDR